MLRGKSIPVILKDTADDVLPEDFPIWEGGSASTIKQAILRHYYMREIGAETVGLWKYFLSTKLQEIMPWYVDLHDRMTEMANIYLNQLATQTDTLDYGHQIQKSGTDTTTKDSTMRDTGTVERDSSDTGTVNHATTDGGTRKVEDSNSAHRESTRSDTGTVSNTGTNDSSGENLMSDTPQNGLESVRQGSYLTKAEIASNTNSVDNTETRNLAGTDNEDSNGSGTSTETRNLNGSDKETRDLKLTNDELRDLMQKLDATESVQYGMKDTHGGTDTRKIVREGFSGDKVDVLERYKKLHLNIVKEIVESCGSCFMGVLG